MFRFRLQNCNFIIVLSLVAFTTGSVIAQEGTGKAILEVIKKKDEKMIEQLLDDHLISGESPVGALSAVYEGIVQLSSSGDSGSSDFAAKLAILVSAKIREMQYSTEKNDLIDLQIERMRKYVSMSNPALDKSIALQCVVYSIIYPDNIAITPSYGVHQVLEVLRLGVSQGTPNEIKVASNLALSLARSAPNVSGLVLLLLADAENRVSELGADNHLADYIASLASYLSVYADSTATMLERMDDTAYLQLIQMSTDGLLERLSASKTGKLEKNLALKELLKRSSQSMEIWPKILELLESGMIPEDASYMIASAFRGLDSHTQTHWRGDLNDVLLKCAIKTRAGVLALSEVNIGAIDYDGLRRKEKSDTLEQGEMTLLVSLLWEVLDSGALDSRKQALVMLGTMSKFDENIRDEVKKHLSEYLRSSKRTEVTSSSSTEDKEVRAEAELRAAVEFTLKSIANFNSN